MNEPEQEAMQRARGAWLQSAPWDVLREIKLSDMRAAARRRRPREIGFAAYVLARFRKPRP